MKTNKLLSFIAFTLFNFSFIYSQVNLDLGLIHYYNFNGTSIPVTGNTNFSSNANFSFTEDSFGNTNSALQFNGTTDFVELENSSDINFSGNFSISLWMGKDSTYSRNDYI